MQRFLEDPFDSKLITCTKPKPKKDKAGGKDDGKKPDAGGAGAGAGAMPNATVSNFFFGGPAVYSAPPGFCQFVNGYPQMPYPPMIAVPQPAPEKPKKEGPPPHVCVACTAENKCKQCLKKEEESKNYVIKQSFSNPRGSYRPSIFSNKVIRSG